MKQEASERMKIKLKLDLSEVAFEGLLAEADARGIELTTLIEDVLEVRAAQRPVPEVPRSEAEAERLGVLEAIIQALTTPPESEGEELATSCSSN